MKNIIKSILFVLLAALLSNGCAYYSTNINALWGSNIKDLEKARAEGVEKTFPLAYDAAFEKVTDILKNNGLTIFQTNRKRKYIVAMGFPKQTDTTRVGIFFEPLSSNETKITLSSLSSTALVKAKALIFTELETKASTIK